MICTENRAEKNEIRLPPASIYWLFPVNNPISQVIAIYRKYWVSEIDTDSKEKGLIDFLS